MRVFNIDITRKGISPVVQVTEYDAMSRFFTLVLRNGSSDYEPPENPTYSVWYKTKDSTGWYDTITLPDESTRPAVVADGNAFTIEIAEQATTSCGELALMINGDDGYQLTISGIITRSDDIPGYDGAEVENYYNVYITEMRENAARAENAADIAVAYGATVEVDEEAQQLNITHHSDTEGGVGWLFGSAVTSSAEGSVASFSDGADDVAVKSLVATITPVQSGSGDPSPTNIRPISGRTGMTVTAFGSNLLNIQPQSGTVSGVSYVVDSDGYITLNGTAGAGCAIFLAEHISPFNFQITISSDNAMPANVYTGLAQQNGNTGLLELRQRETVKTSGDSGISEETRYRIYIVNGTTLANYKYRPMLNFGSTVLPYAPYVARTEYPISWQTEAGTVYGGTLDVVSGVLTVTHALWTDNGTVPWSRTGTGQFYVWQSFVANAVYTEDGCACNYAKYRNDYSGFTAFVRTANGTVTLGDGWGTLYASAEELKAAFAQTPLQIVYKLATPTTYQLTPTEVRTILGENNIYTDAGDTSVEYIADTKLYIDNKIAELQALVLENN